MPQFDPAHFLSQGIWLFICFCLLWGFMHFRIIPLFHKLTILRSKETALMEEETQKCRKETEILYTRMDDLLKKAQNQASDSIQAALKEVDKKIQSALQCHQDDYAQKIGKERLMLQQKVDDFLMTFSHEVPCLLDDFLTKWQIDTLPPGPSQHDQAGDQSNARFS